MPEMKNFELPGISVKVELKSPPVQDSALDMVNLLEDK
jgi:hypothetical protein